MAHFVLSYIARLKKFTNTPNTKYAIIVPYLGQRAVYLRTILAAGEEFEGITVATANSFMGWENAFVFVAAGNLGGKVGFVADRHRIAVLLTRQSQFLMVLAIENAQLFRRRTPPPKILQKRN